ncbi:MAG: pantoate--beta-alanine ligase [Dehalococcoidia bacterium]
MEIARSIPQMREARRNLGEPVGFVPTMGYLHEGHLSLVRKARSADQSVVASIFVNPTQFGPGEDFQDYPRDTDRDLALLQREGVDVVFMPEPGEMYPDDFNTWVDVRGVTGVLEGASRPEHFTGVSTVVAKLFNIVEPDRAYFGQKDAQQVVVIKRMVADLNMNLEIVACPTVRELDGLAMSSRNIYLSQQEREAALALWKSLNLAHRLWSEGERDAEKIRQQMRSLIEQERQVGLEYVSIADARLLQEMENVDRPAVVSLAVRVGKARLIDNIPLGCEIEDIGD